MTCTTKGCGHNWCYICLGDWSKHGSSWYKCNFYDSEVKKGDSKLAKFEQDRIEAEKNLKRFEFYE